MRQDGAQCARQCCECLGRKKHERRTQCVLHRRELKWLGRRRRVGRLAWRTQRQRLTYALQQRAPALIEAARKRDAYMRERDLARVIPRAERLAAERGAGQRKVTQRR